MLSTQLRITSAPAYFGRDRYSQTYKLEKKYLGFKLFAYLVSYEIKIIYIICYEIHNNLHLIIYREDHIYEMHTIRFQIFFVRAFKIVLDSWKFSMLLLYILWDDEPIFMISGSNEQLQQQLEYTLLKPDCHSWWITKIRS